MTETWLQKMAQQAKVKAGIRTIHDFGVVDHFHLGNHRYRLEASWEHMPDDLPRSKWHSELAGHYGLQVMISRENSNFATNGATLIYGKERIPRALHDFFEGLQKLQQQALRRPLKRNALLSFMDGLGGGPVLAWNKKVQIGTVSQYQYDLCIHRRERQLYLNLTQNKVGDEGLVQLKLPWSSVGKLMALIEKLH